MAISLALKLLGLMLSISNSLYSVWSHESLDWPTFLRYTARSQVLAVLVTPTYAQAVVQAPDWALAERNSSVSNFCIQMAPIGADGHPAYAFF